MHINVNLTANHCLTKLSDLQLRVDICAVMVPCKTFTILMRDWLRMIDKNPNISICTRIMKKKSAYLKRHHFSKRCPMCVWNNGMPWFRSFSKHTQSQTHRKGTLSWGDGSCRWHFVDIMRMWKMFFCMAEVLIKWNCLYHQLNIFYLQRWCWCIRGSGWFLGNKTAFS